MSGFGTLPTVNVCLGNCKYSCSNTCTGGCNLQCSNPCKGGCGDNCGATCSQTCRGFCTKSCYSGCTASCANNCETECLNGCGGTCKGGCGGTCRGGCGGCDSGCSSCTGTCRGGCKASCNGKCQGTCKSGCGNQCKDGATKNLSSFKINDLNIIEQEDINFIINAIKYEVTRRKETPVEVSIKEGDSLTSEKVEILIDNLKKANSSTKILIAKDKQKHVLKEEIKAIIADLKEAWDEIIDPNL